MQTPFNELSESLLQVGIAPRHVRRYVTELRDHFADLVAEVEQTGETFMDAQAEAFSRLGTIDTLAKAMIEHRDFRSWTARAPWATLFLGPTLTLFCAYLLAIGSFFFIVYKFGTLAGQSGHLTPPAWLLPVSQPVFFFDQFVFPILVGWCIAGLAIRQRLRSLWPMVGLLAIELLGAGIAIDIQWPASPGAPGGVTVGVAFLPPFTCFWSRFVAHGAVNLILTAVPYGLLKQRITRPIAV